MTDPDPDLQEGLVDRYRILRELGRGGMATVYLADDLRHGRKVAIKVLNSETRAAIGPDRFLREIEIAAQLTHPHILPLHDSGAVAGRFFYVMPFIEGESLRARISREGQLPIDEALRLAREIASALAYAHRKGMVHRDIKPENVLLADGYALVADFGIARIMSAGATGAEDSPGSQGLTTEGVLIGTPAYMAPEQATGSSEVDSRADLYALGCVLYEMLAGQPPFTGRVDALLHQHVRVDPRPVTDLRPSVPKSVATAIMKVLSKLPADRHPTAARFAEALAVATEPRAATPLPEAEAVVTANNLPKQRSRFIGRERELAESARLLGDSRLLTLTGIGGGGKTRLALRVAEQHLPSFPDGVWFVDLAPVQDAERVPRALAAAVGVSETPGTPLMQRLTGHFAAHAALIVLDNCEHVIGAAAELAEELLGACERLKLLVTSREGLGIAGEQILALRSLALPVAGATELRAIETAEAVRLFVDRAQLADPRFVLDQATAPVVAEICRRLDGIPLALELAAVRVKMLSVEEIHARLGDRFRLLTGGRPSALARHQTLLATIGWSYDQLSAEEQRLFRRLSVLAGGWTLEAAVATAGADADEFEVLDLLTRLVDKSLVTPAPARAGTRYTMLETVRQYAQDRLGESGEGDAARTRHLGFFLALAEEARPKLQGPEQGEWLSRLDTERENLLAAHAWCALAEGGAEAGLRLVYAMQLYWLARGLLELGYGVTVEAVARPAAAAPTLARVLALYAAGQLGYLIGRFDQAERHLNESLAIARGLGASLRVASVLRALGFVELGRGDRPAARRRLEESLRLSREIGEKRELSIVLNTLAELERIEGNLDAAEPLYQEFLAIERELANPDHTASGLLNLSMVAIGRGEPERARPLLLEALAIADAIGSKRIGQGVLEVAAGLAVAAGAPESAARAFGAADALREQMGLHRDTADDAFLLPLIERARTTLGDPAFADCENAGRALSYEDAKREVRRLLSASAAAGERTVAVAPRRKRPGGLSE